MWLIKATQVWTQLFSTDSEGKCTGKCKSEGSFVRCQEVINGWVRNQLACCCMRGWGSPCTCAWLEFLAKVLHKGMCFGDHSPTGRKEHSLFSCPNFIFKVFCRGIPSKYYAWFNLWAQRSLCQVFAWYGRYMSNGYSCTCFRRRSKPVGLRRFVIYLNMYSLNDFWHLTAWRWALKLLLSGWVGK